MNNELERFARENREEFDSAEVPPALWERIEQQISPAKKKSPIIKMGWMKMAAAAAVIAAIGLGTFKLMNNKNTGAEVVTNNTGVQNKDNDTPTTKEPVIAKQEPANENTNEPQTSLAENETPKESEINNQNDADQELYHFTKLIQIKQKQLLSIKHDSPELYEHFVADYNKLDVSYNELKEEMKTNPNKEVLLEKMIGNLQLQIDLLNQQLKVVRQLNKIKKDKANEISKTM
ncbi:MAG: hypothetical protein ACM3H8_09215 [Sphingobacteriales bacterium]